MFSPQRFERVNRGILYTGCSVISVILLTAAKTCVTFIVQLIKINELDRDLLLKVSFKSRIARRLFLYFY